MSKFLTPLRFQDENGLPFTLTDPLRYRSDALGTIVEAPAGMQTDLASIPRGLWNILPPVGAYDRAAVLHDACYRFGRIVTTADGFKRELQFLTRAEADAVLREAMDVCGVGRFERWLIWSGVRVGGRGIWSRYRAAEKVEAAA